MTLDDIPDIEKAYGDEIDRLLLQIQLKEITLCETCDTFFKYIPQKRFCDICKVKHEKERRREYAQRPEAKERNREYYKKNREKILERSREYNRRPEVKKRNRVQQREYRQRPEAKERKREYGQEYYKKNREKILERSREYHRRKKGEEE